MTDTVSGSTPNDGARSSRPVRQLLTVAEVRAAIADVAAGAFGAVKPSRPLGDSQTSPESEASGGAGTSGDVGDPEAHGQHMEPPAHRSTPGQPLATSTNLSGPAAPRDTDDSFTSAGLLEQWATCTEQLDRQRAYETARLAAFALSRVLYREGGEQELEEFLTARTAFDDVAQDASGTALGTNGQYTDPRVSARARELIAPEDAIVIAVKLKKSRLETARRMTAAAIVAFLGLHNLLTSAAQGRIAMERVTRLGFRIDDAFLPLSEVQALDRYLDDLSPDISMDQYEKQARMHIRMLDPLPQDPDAARKKRCVRLERCDDDSAILTMAGPIDAIEALFQRLRAMARAIRRHELGALGLSKDGLPVDAADLSGRLVEDRRIAELMFDLLAAARPQTQVRVGSRRTPETTDITNTPGIAGRCLAGDSTADVDSSKRDLSDSVSTESASAKRHLASVDSTERDLVGASAPDNTSTAPLADGSIVDVLCPTNGSWLRKQAAVTVTVPLTTVMGLDEHPGRINGDVPLSAQRCREAASHSTSWYRVLTDPATSIVTDHIAQTYEPTAAMRRTIRQKWRTCTVPGCSQPAEWCEIEHCCSFSKRDPRTGGQTVMENLHPMCKHHHQLKSMGVIRLKRLGKDDVAWILPMGVTATTSPPPLARRTNTHGPDELLHRAQTLSDLPVDDAYEGPDLFSTVVEPEDDADEAPPF